MRLRRPSTTICPTDSVAERLLVRDDLIKRNAAQYFRLAETRNIHKLASGAQSGLAFVCVQLAAEQYFIYIHLKSL
jgi:hypothetical protein